MRAIDDTTRDLLADSWQRWARLAAVADVALVESTVHLLDLVDAVGSVGPSTGAVEATRDVLIAVPDPTAAVEILAGRVTPSCVLPVIR